MVVEDRRDQSPGACGAGGPPAPPSAAQPQPSNRPGSRAAAKKAMPAFVQPMLATPVSTPPADQGRWVHEIKFDGYRMQARIDEGAVTPLTRTGLDWTDKFGSGVVDALRRLPLREPCSTASLSSRTLAVSRHFSSLQADLSEGRRTGFLIRLRLPFS